MKKSRIWELDFLRGFAIVMVTFDHAMYDLAYVFSSWSHSGKPVLAAMSEFGQAYMNGETRFFWRPAFLFLFFCISGICTAFSHNNLIRGARLFVVSAALSVVTYFVQEIFGFDCFILFGVLHCLAVITLAYAVFDLAYTLIFKAMEKKRAVSPALKKLLRAGILLALSVAFFLIQHYYNVRLYDAFGSGKAIEYNNDFRGLFFFEDSWWTADYFPLFPYIAFFFLGAALSEPLYAKRKSLMPSLDGSWHYVFSVPGRYSLWIYLGGQLLALGFLYTLDAMLLG